MGEHDIICVQDSVLVCECERRCQGCNSAGSYGCHDKNIMMIHACMIIII